MRSLIYLAVSVFAAVVAAQSPNPFNVPREGYDFTSGEPTTLTWKPTTDGTITLKLQVGKDITPESGEVIAENIPNSGSYSFVPPSDVQPDTKYTVEIIDDTNPDNYNFTPTFTIDGGSSQTTTSAEMTTTSEADSTTTSDATTTADTTASTETDAESSTTTDSESSTTTDASATGTTMTTSSGTASGTSTDSESSTGTTTAETTVQSTTAPGAGVSLKVHGGMFALVAGVMAAL